MAGSLAIGQAEFAQPCWPATRRHLIRRSDWQESGRQNLQNFLARQVNAERLSDHGTAAAQDRDRHALQDGIAQQPLFRGTAGPAQRITLSQRELDVLELLFHAAGQGKIEIVAAEQKVLADGGSLKLQLAIDQASAHQAEVGRAAADVADQNQIAIAEVFTVLIPRQIRVRGWAIYVRAPIRRDPRIKRGQRFFEQSELVESGAAGGFDRQLARFLIERSWHGEDDFLMLKTRFCIGPNCAVPGVAQMHEVARRSLNRGNHRLRRFSLRRQDLGAAIHARIGKPRLGR